MLAEIAQTRLRQKRTEDVVVNHLRKERLPAKVDRKEQRNAVGRWPKIITTPLVCCTNVERCAHPQFAYDVEIFGRERALEIECGCDRGLGPRKRYPECIGRSRHRKVHRLCFHLRKAKESRSHRK